MSDNMSGPPYVMHRRKTKSTPQKLADTMAALDKVLIDKRRLVSELKAEKEENARLRKQIDYIVKNAIDKLTEIKEQNGKPQQ